MKKYSRDLSTPLAPSTFGGGLRDSKFGRGLRASRQNGIITHLRYYEDYWRKKGEESRKPVRQLNTLRRK